MSAPLPRVQAGEQHADTLGCSKNPADPAGARQFVPLPRVQTSLTLRPMLAFEIIHPGGSHNKGDITVPHCMSEQLQHDPSKDIMQRWGKDGGTWR